MSRAHARAGKSFGGDPRELPGRPVLSPFAPGTRETVGRLLARGDAPNSGTVLPGPVLGEPGEPLDIDLTVRPFGPGGRTGWAPAIRELREREAPVWALTERAAQFARSNRDLPPFAYIASHDLPEPLRIVSSYTDLVPRRYRGGLGTDADGFLRFVREVAVRRPRLIDGPLLGYFAAESWDVRGAGGEVMRTSHASPSVG